MQMWWKKNSNRIKIKYNQQQKKNHVSSSFTSYLLAATALPVSAGLTLRFIFFSSSHLCAPGPVVDPQGEPGRDRPLQSTSGRHVREKKQGRRALPGPHQGGQRHGQAHHLWRSAQRQRCGQQGGQTVWLVGHWGAGAGGRSEKYIMGYCVENVLWFKFKMRKSIRTKYLLEVLFFF